MEAIDMSRLDVAIKYIQRIADGCNPVSNEPVEDDAVLNDPNVIRCMFFVKDVLEEVRRSNGVTGSKRAKPRKEPFPFEILKHFQYQEDKTISHLLDQIHAPAEGLDIKRISPQTITGWLKTAGYLTVEYCQEVRKESTLPTQKGRDLGIYTEVRTYGANSYVTVIYNRQAQEFLVMNFEAIVNGEVVECEDQQ